MFRLKIIGTHVVLVGLLIAVAHFLLRGDIENQIEEEQETGLRRAAVVAEQHQRLDHFALREKAEEIADGIELYKYMTLEERQDLFEQLRGKYSGQDLKKKLGQKEAGGDENEEDGGDEQEGTKGEKKEGDENSLSTTEVRHLAVHEELLTWKFRFSDWEKNTKEGRNVDRSLERRKPMQPEMVMIVDRNGVGVAALGQDRYSWFGDNLSRDYQVLTDVASKSGASARLDVWRFAWGPGDSSSLYQIAMAPIRRRSDERPAGAVVLGYTIHEGVAKDIQETVTGVTTAEESQVRQDQLARAPEIAFFRGKELFSTTFSSSVEEGLTAELFDDKGILAEDNPDELVDVSLEGDQYRALVRFFPGQFDSDPPTGFVVLTNVSEAKKPIGAAVTSFATWAAGAMLLGALLMFFFYQRFIRPVANIEDTIGDILAGNKDAEFVLSREHPVFSSLVQGLNLMSAYLQGKPMPDEEEELEGWGDVAGSVGEAEEGGGGDGSPDVQGVEMPGMGGGDREDDEEPTS